VPVFAFPFDLAGPVEKALAAVNPGIVLLTETEIWPLFLERAAARGIPAVLVNGRVSDRSFRRYSAVRSFLEMSLRRVSLFAMQSAEDAARIEALGAPSDRVQVTGNVKYDLAEAPPFPDAARLREAASGRPVLVAASTAEGEEEAVLAAWRSLEAGVRPLLALAPRRPERFEAVAGLLENSGLAVLRRSSAPAAVARPGRNGDSRGVVYLLDSIGELVSLYREARLAFIGGSLAPQGGHNPIEAWSAGVPVLVGPHTENFRQITEEGEANGFARRVSDERDLARELARAFSPSTGVSDAGERARLYVAQNRGAADRTVDLLMPFLEAPARRRAAP